jgi:hypothetical protein
MRTGKFGGVGILFGIQSMQEKLMWDLRFRVEGAFYLGRAN